MKSRSAAGSGSAGSRLPAIAIAMSSVTSSATCSTGLKAITATTSSTWPALMSRMVAARVMSSAARSTAYQPATWPRALMRQRIACSGWSRLRGGWRGGIGGSLGMAEPGYRNGGSSQPKNQLSPKTRCRAGLSQAGHDDPVQRHDRLDGEFQRLVRVELLKLDGAGATRAENLDVGERRLVLAGGDLRHDEIARPHRQARVHEHRLAGKIARLHRIADHIDRIGIGNPAQRRRRDDVANPVAVERELAVLAADRMPIDRDQRVEGVLKSHACVLRRRLGAGRFGAFAPQQPALGGFQPLGQLGHQAGALDGAGFDAVDALLRHADGGRELGLGEAGIAASLGDAPSERLGIDGSHAPHCTNFSVSVANYFFG